MHVFPLLSPVSLLPSAASQLSVSTPPLLRVPASVPPLLYFLLLEEVCGCTAESNIMVLKNSIWVPRLYYSAILCTVFCLVVLVAIALHI